MPEIRVQVAPVRFAGIELSDAGIKPTTGNLATLIRTPDIKEIEVRHGFLSAHPILQMLFGSLLATTLWSTVAVITAWVRHGGVIFDTELFMLIPGGLGVWLLISAFARGYYLIIATNRGRRKLAFDHKAPRSAVIELARELRNRKFRVIDTCNAERPI